jgi:hypothetical protein
MTVGDRERSIDAHVAMLVLADDHFGPLTVERVGALPPGQRCSGRSGQQADCYDKPLHKAPPICVFLDTKTDLLLDVLYTLSVGIASLRSMARARRSAALRNANVRV